MEILFGFLGVIVGSTIPWIKEEWHRKRSRKENGQFLAVQIIALLEEYGEKCVEVVQDNGTYMGQASERNAAGEEYYFPAVKLPSAPTYPDGLDWRSIECDLMYRILMLPSKIRDTDNGIRFISDEIASPPDFSELFEARWEGYAKLGLEAMEISAELCELFKLPHKKHYVWNPDWNPKAYLEGKLESLEKGKTKNAEKQEALLKTINKAGNNNDV